MASSTKEPTKEAGTMDEVKTITPAMAVETVALQENFFNVNMIGYAIGSTKVHTFLRVRAWGKGKKDGVRKIPDQYDSPAELDEDGSIPRGLFVGMWPKDAASWRSDNKKTRHKEGDRKSLNEMGKATIISAETPAARVVVQNKVTTGPIFYYALVNRGEDQLCETVVVNQEEVFFHKRFRDDSLKSLEKRRNHCSSSVRSAIEKLQQEKASKHFRSAKQPAKPVTLTTDPRLAAGREAEAIMRIYTEAPNERLLEEAMECLKIFDCDTQYRLPSTVGINRVLDYLRQYSDADTLAALEEMRRLWPDLAKDQAGRFLTFDRVKCLALAVREEKISLPFSLLRAVFTICCYHVNGLEFLPTQDTEAAQEHRKNMIDQGLQAAAQVLGPTAPGVPKTTTSLDGYTVALLELWILFNEAIITASKEETRAIQDVAGPQLVEDSLAELLQSIPNCPDVDSIKFLFQQAYRMIARQLASTNHRLEALLEKNNASVKQLLQDLQGSAGGENEEQGQGSTGM